MGARGRGPEKILQKTRTKRQKMARSGQQHQQPLLLQVQPALIWFCQMIWLSQRRRRKNRRRKSRTTARRRRRRRRRKRRRKRRRRKRKGLVLNLLRRRNVTGKWW